MTSQRKKFLIGLWGITLIALLALGWFTASSCREPTAVPTLSPAPTTSPAVAVTSGIVVNIESSASRRLLSDFFTEARKSEFKRILSLLFDLDADLFTGAFIEAYESSSPTRRLQDTNAYTLGFTVEIYAAGDADGAEDFEVGGRVAAGAGRGGEGELGGGRGR